MSRARPQPPSYHSDRTNFGEITPERVARVGRELHVNSPSVVRIRPADKEALADESLQPAKCRRGGNCCRNAEARNWHTHLGDFRLKQIEQHIPRRICKKLLSEVLPAKPTSPDDVSNGVTGQRRQLCSRHDL